MKGYVVIQRNSKGVVSMATAVLDTFEEAQAAIAVSGSAFPTMQFRIVELRPASGWESPVVDDRRQPSSPHRGRK